jgi:hypothetical protein
MQATAGNAAVAAYLQRKPVKAEAPPAKADKGAPTDLAAEVETMWEPLLAFSKMAMPELRRVSKHTKWHLERYDKAWATFSARLSAAQREAARREKWNQAIAGIIIGTGVGLAAGPLFKASQLLVAALREAAGEAAELGIGSQIDASTGVDFAPPEATADKEARKHLDTLLQAAVGVAGIQAAALAYSPRRDQIRAGGGAVNPASVRAEVARLKRALSEAERAFATFLTTMDTPVMQRSETQIEQDLWVAWMSKRPENANQILGDDSLATYLQNIGVLGRIAADRQVLTGRVHELAQREQKRLSIVGKVGVIIVPPRRPGHIQGWERGVVKLRHDAYAPAGRPDPDRSAPEEHHKVNWEQGAYLRPGEVVMVTGTTATGVTVARLAGELAVSDDERSKAMQFAGIEEATYVPEAADRIAPIVQGGIAYADDLKQAKLRVVATHDGVLVTEREGAKLVLFCPLTAGVLRDARTRRARTGAARAVVVQLDPGVHIWDYRDGQITMTRDASAATLVAEIRAARELVGGKPTR